MSRPTVPASSRGVSLRVLGRLPDRLALASPLVLLLSLAFPLFLFLSVAFPLVPLTALILPRLPTLALAPTLMLALLMAPLSLPLIVLRLVASAECSARAHTQAGRTARRRPTRSVVHAVSFRDPRRCVHKRVQEGAAQCVTRSGAVL